MKRCPKCQSIYPDSASFCLNDATELIASGDLLVGTTIRRKYRIEEEIGRGGMGVVYRATHLLLKEVRALKLINAQHADDPRFVERFLTEALIARQMQHPNIVRVDDADETEDGRPFVVMEYIRGEDLRKIISRDGCIEPSRAFYIASQVCAALAVAHQAGIIHRDIKPDNILVAIDKHGNETVKVMDFGIAKAKSESKASLQGAPTLTGMFLFTPQYCSPEQGAGRKGEELDGRTDLYSLGIVLYEMLTGRLPFSADTPFGIVQQHIESRPPMPQAMKPDLKLTNTALAVITRALEKDRTSRYANAEEMRLALEMANQSLRRSKRERVEVSAPAAGVQKSPDQANLLQSQNDQNIIQEPLDKGPVVAPTVKRKAEAASGDRVADPSPSWIPAQQYYADAEKMRLVWETANQSLRRGKGEHAEVPSRPAGPQQSKEQPNLPRSRHNNVVQAILILILISLLVMVIWALVVGFVHS